MRSYFLFFILFMVLFSACQSEDAEIQEPSSPPPPAEPPPLVSCVDCHDNIVLDEQHRLPCTSCHQGNAPAENKEQAHLAMIYSPAHPKHMVTTCGSCHEKEAKAFNSSLHHSSKNEVNAILAHFGGSAVGDLAEIPVQATIETELDLANDMLRRRCLRCHFYTSGDDYPYVSRGKGCAACHLQFSGGSMVSHTFQPPAERQCLSCHYGSHVGNDYHGRYENDYNWEYRTPYTTREEYSRPYGVEQHDLAADIHQQQGMTCANCHDFSTHGDTKELTCLSCHGWDEKHPVPAIKGIDQDGSVLTVFIEQSTKTLSVPPLQHPAHERYGDQVSCQVCHGQWSYNDSTTHLVLTSSEDYDIWDRLTVQSSSEVEHYLDHNLYSDEDELEPAMKDGITGEKRPGIWFKGFTQRRWEDMLIKKDSDGIIKVFRPILDLRLSAIDENDEVLFDNIQGESSGHRPYTPHTTGKAGLFYLSRFNHLLASKAP